VRRPGEVRELRQRPGRSSCWCSLLLTVASARGLGRSDRGGRRLLIEFSYSSFGPVNRKCVCSGREGCAGLHACARSRSLVGSVGGVR
jgi:hypothetical protein